MAAGATIAALAGCSSSGSSSPQAAESSVTPIITNGSPTSAGYWTQQRLRAASEWQPEPVSSASPKASGDAPSPSATQNATTLRVGAIFDHDSSGDHFCTASVVDSPKENVIVTAAHCINGGSGGANKQDITFVPGYTNGNVPYGEWTPSRYVMDSRWVNDHNENYDMAFVVLKQHEGKNIQEVLGGNTIEFNPGFRHYVRVVGYPQSADAAITCANWTSEQDGYLKFDCGGYYGGTSGSPWITDYNTQTRTGKVVGVLGGYLEGGSVHSTSYSSYLGDGVKKLYDDAIGS
jgi:V8-like Glu-specific endopeptidase